MPYGHCTEAWLQKDVFERYLLRSNLANLILSEGIATKRPRWVYYIITIIRFGVGWLSCLSWERAMREPERGISSRKFLPRLFLCPEPNLITYRRDWESGRRCVMSLSIINHQIINNNHGKIASFESNASHVNHELRWYGSLCGWNHHLIRRP